MCILKIILFNSIILVAILAFTRLLGRRMDRKQEALFQDKTSPSATVRGRCMVRESFMEEPGVAQVLEGMLSIYTVTGKAMKIPLDLLELVKVRKNYLGRYPWWGKTVMTLDAPKISGLVLGVENPTPWLNAFKI